MSICKHFFLPLLSFIYFSNVAFAQSWQAISTDKQAAVIELFVSEGCGLCPPAEHWAETLPSQGVDDESQIVLAYHVDYLNDKKGWIDRFAKPTFTKRQQQLARLNLFKTVFTPELFFSGEVVHSWKEHGMDAISFINSFQPEAKIILQAEQEHFQLKIKTQIEVEGAENRTYSVLYLILKQDNIISHIRGGDNYGATFNHQDLVRELMGPFELNAEGKTTIQTQIKIQPEWDLNQLELVGFVQNLSDGYVLQGLSLPLRK